MIAGLPVPSWILLICAVGLGLALVIPFWLSNRGDAEGDDSWGDGGEGPPEPTPVVRPEAGAGVER